MAEELKLNNPDELEDWLKDKPAAWSRIIAFRSALRVLPSLGELTNLPQVGAKPNHGENLIIAALRSNLLSSALHTHQADRIISAATDAAANAAIDAVNTVGDVAEAIHAAVDAVTAAADAAVSSSAAYDDDVTVAITYAAHTAASAAYAAADATYENDNDYKDDDGVRRLWLSISNDALWLESHKEFPAPKRSALLARQPLWHGNAPKRLQAKWHHLADSELSVRHSFECWIRWYEALSPFDATTPPRDAFGEALTRRIATQSNVWWERSALEINTDIARWLAEEATSPPIKDATAKLAEAIDQLPDAPESPEVFDWRDGRLEVLPPQALSEDDGVAQDYLEEAREKAEHMLDRLRRTNADPAITRAVKKLLDVLTDRPSDLRPARVDSCADTLRFLVETHNNDADERELSSVVLAGLMDLSLTTRKLCSCLPMMWKREAAHLTDSLPTDPTDTFQNLETVRHTAEDSGILGDSARATLATQSSDVTDQTAEPLRRREIAKYLLIARDLMLKMLRGAGAKATDMAKALADLAKEAAQAARPELVKEISKDMVKGYKLARVAAVGGVAYVFTNASEAISHITQLPGFEELAQVAKWIARLISSGVGL